MLPFFIVWCSWSSWAEIEAIRECNWSFSLVLTGGVSSGNSTKCVIWSASDFGDMQSHIQNDLLGSTVFWLIIHRRCNCSGMICSNSKTCSICRVRRFKTACCRIALISSTAKPIWWQKEKKWNGVLYQKIRKNTYQQIHENDSNNKKKCSKKYAGSIIESFFCRRLFFVRKHIFVFEFTNCHYHGFHHGWIECAKFWLEK